MAFGGRKGELVTAIDGGTNSLVSVKLESNVMRVRSNTRCFFEQG